MFAYYRSLPPQRAGVLMLGMLGNALVSLLLYALVLRRLAMLAARVRTRRATGEPLPTSGDANRSGKVLLAAVVSYDVLRRVAIRVLRRRVAAAIRDGTADPAAAARILADPVERSKTTAELRRTDPDPGG